MTPLLALAAALLAAASPFQAEHPMVREGNERLLSGDAAAALARYQAAEQAVGPHPEIDFDRGGALQAQGRRAEALEAWRRAAGGDAPGPLASRALQNSGNALDAAGDAEGARRAFVEALRRDPGNEDARYNLEVLQRRKPPPPRPEDQPGDGKQPQGQPPQPSGPRSGADQAARPQAPPPDQDQAAEQRRAAEQRAAAERDRERPQAGREADQPPPDPRQGPAGQRPARPPELDRQDALRLLDALRARERNMPLEPTARKDARRRDVEKDW